MFIVSTEFPAIIAMTKLFKVVCWASLTIKNTTDTRKYLEQQTKTGNNKDKNNSYLFKINWFSNDYNNIYIFFFLSD